MNKLILPLLYAGSALALLTGCGGGGGKGGPPAVTATDLPASRAEASRFLTQATFGPTDASVDSLMTTGYGAWLDQQLAMAPSSPFLAYIESRQATFTAYNQGRTTGLKALGPSQFYEQFYGMAAGAQEQVRLRAAFALSQIFVVSMQDPTVGQHLRTVGAYYDQLVADAFGNYRNLLEHVSLHPAMGIYLSTLRNQKEDPATGRLPDENYAREVMQLMSIGLYQLNPDGTVRADSAGNPLPAYTYDDIAGLAKVFTGWSWYAPTPTTTTWYNAAGSDSEVKAMSPYPTFHSNAAKTFLGTTVAPAAAADPTGDLKVALDTLYNHPNVGPFMALRLIQQLVTSNPSPAYVGRVAAAFNDNGAKVRGDLKAVFRAVLMDPEARDPAKAQDPAFGKLREPVLRLTNWLRAFGATSQSGQWQLGPLDSPSSQLAQSPLNAGSVFNFWRPGYIPPNSRLAQAGLAGPEFQAVNEVSVAGYLNFMQNLIPNGLGGGAGAVPPTTGSDIASAYTVELNLAGNPDALATRMGDVLMCGQMSAALHQQLVAAITSVAIPTTGTQAAIDQAKKNRVSLAVFMAMASPEYLVQH